jgi:hypothetical protein
MMNLPKGFPQLCYDMKQYQNQYLEMATSLIGDITDFNTPNHKGIKHHALHDAIHEMEKLVYLKGKMKTLLSDLDKSLAKKLASEKCDHCDNDSDYTYNYCDACFDRLKN